MRKVIKNARLIRELTEGYTDETANLEIIDGKIAGIYPCNTAFPDAEEYDAGGKTVLPGMIDLHMHLYFYTADFHELAVASRDQNLVLLHALEYAKSYIRQGFTTIRDCGNPYNIGIAVKMAVERGIIEGPRIYTAGRSITPTTKGNSLFQSLYAEVNHPWGIIEEGRRQISEGVDFLKYMGTGAVANSAGEPGALITTKEELAAIQRVAESLNTYVAVHCHGKKGIMLCAETGIRTIEHASEIDEQCTELILKNGGRTAIVPTLDPIALMQAGLLSDASSKKIRDMEQDKGPHKMLLASRAGVLTGWGTDISMDFFVKNPGCEFVLRSNRGYTNIEILQQATINSAKILGIEDRLGTIKAGKCADLVIIDGKPDEDICVMQKLPYAVFKDGNQITE